MVLGLLFYLCKWFTPLAGGLVVKALVFMKKENNRKIGLRYNEDIDSFEKSDKRMKG